MWTSKKSAKKATSMETVWYPGFADYIWVKAVYQLGDDLTGKDLHTGYWHFCTAGTSPGPRRQSIYRVADREAELAQGGSF